MREEVQEEVEKEEEEEEEGKSRQNPHCKDSFNGFHADISQHSFWFFRCC